MDTRKVGERAKDALGVLALVYGVYGDVMFSWSTLKRGNEGLIPESKKGSVTEAIQNLFLTGFYNGIKKSRAIQEKVLPQDEVVSIEQQLERQIGGDLEKRLMDEIKNKSSFVNKIRQDADHSIRKLRTTDIRQALLEEDGIFSANILSK